MMSTRKKIVLTAVILLVIVLVPLVFRYQARIQSLIMPWTIRNMSPVFRKPEKERTVYDWIVVGAKEEVLARVRYDAAYQNIEYPMGDVEPEVGACTDVVIRALRRAGYDMQELIHQDMKANFHLYPQLWGLRGPDSNIDHRRTQNQVVFLQRFGETLPFEYTPETQDTWQPGDLVYWKMPTGRGHTGVISDWKNRKGVPLVIHNAFITIEDDVLLEWEIIGHYRFPREN